VADVSASISFEDCSIVPYVGAFGWPLQTVATRPRSRYLDHSSPRKEPPSSPYHTIAAHLPHLSYVYTIPNLGFQEVIPPTRSSVSKPFVLSNNEQAHRSPVHGTGYEPPACQVSYSAFHPLPRNIVIELSTLSMCDTSASIHRWCFVLRYKTSHWRFSDSNLDISTILFVSARWGVSRFAGMYAM